MHYPGESANLPYSNYIDSIDDNDGIDPCCPPSPTNNGAHPLSNDNRSTQLPQSSGARQQGGILENTTAYSSPETTRSMSRARCLLATAEDASNEDGPSATTSSQKKKALTWRKNVS
jgi:hypothetical protein